MTTEVLERLTQLWDRPARGPRLARLAAMVLATAVAASPLARVGSFWARAMAALVIALVAALSTVALWRERRALRGERERVRRVVGAADAPAAARLLRALGAVERTARDEYAGSAELARHHYDGLLRAVSATAVQSAGVRRGARARAMALVLGALVTAAFALGGRPILEGLNVLFARAGVAPVRMRLLAGRRVWAQPPAHLREPAVEVFGQDVLALPVGTEVSVRGEPVSDEHSLVFGDGVAEVPFVPDGSGQVVARLVLRNDARLRVGARFGDVVVEEDGELWVRAEGDSAPVVALEGAPRDVALGAESTLALLWHASDDHGLRQIDLVLRWGDQEERRVLRKLGGELTRVDGTEALAESDQVLRRAVSPVSITVEAKDTDRLAGPKWGASRALVVRPAAVGSAEAERYQALRALRRSLEDLLVGAMAAEAKPHRAVGGGVAERPGGSGAGSPWDPKAALTELEQVARSALGRDYHGHPVPEGLSTFLMGQIERVQGTHGRLAQARPALEGALLAMDAALEALAAKDVREVASRLAEVAAEAALMARRARGSEARGPFVARLDGAVETLRAGAARLLVLGAYGRDLGSVVESELGRLARARRGEDLLHAGLVAEHLEGRLRRPNPSFTGGGGSGVESGAGQGSDGGADSGRASEADRHFDELAADLARLVRDHKAEVGRLESMIGEEGAATDLGQERAGLIERAAGIEEAVAGLPPPGADPGTRAASASHAREQARAMAGALREGALDRAVQAGRDALGALDAARSQGGAAPDDLLLETLSQRLARELAWLATQQQEAGARRDARLRRELPEEATAEQALTERAERLLDRAEAGPAPLGRELTGRLRAALGSMRQAVAGLRAGEGEPALGSARRAQELLDVSTPASTTSSPKRGGKEGGGGPPEPTEGDHGVVPDEAEARSDELRRRILRGLSADKSGRLAPAVQRYAEGLLR